MSEWTSKTLRALIGDPVSGSRPVGGVDSKSEGVPSLGGENILSDGGVTFNELKRVPRAFYDSMPRGHLQPFDVLINKDGAQTGKVAIYKGEFDDACVNEHLFILRGREGAVDQSFLYYSLLHPETQAAIARRITGSAQPGLNSRFVDAVEIKLPSEPDRQIRIAEILSTVDDAIEQTEKLIAKHQQIKAGLMHDLFTRGLTPDGRLRPPRDEAPHLYKDSPLGPIPKEWETSELGRLYAEPARNGLYKPAEFHGRGPVMLQMGDMFRGMYLDVQTGRRVAVSPSELATYGLREGDLLFGRRSLVLEGAGRCVIVEKLVGAATFESSIIRVRVDQSRLLPRFAAEFLSTEAAHRDRRRYIRQVAVSGVSGLDVKQFRVVLPNTQEQLRISSAVESSNLRIQYGQQTLYKLQMLKAGLMHDLLTGEVPVPIPEAEDHA